MKVIVICDERGEIESVALPDPKQANNLSVIPDDGGSVHELTVGKEVASRESLSGELGDEARRNAFEALRHLL